MIFFNIIFWYQNLISFYWYQNHYHPGDNLAFLDAKVMLNSESENFESKNGSVFRKKSNRDHLQPIKDLSFQESIQFSCDLFFVM